MKLNDKVTIEEAICEVGSYWQKEGKDAKLIVVSYESFTKLEMELPHRIQYLDIAFKGQSYRAIQFPYFAGMLIVAPDRAIQNGSVKVFAEKGPKHLTILEQVSKDNTLMELVKV